MATYKKVPAAIQIKIAEIQGSESKELDNINAIRMPLGVIIENPNAMNTEMFNEIIDFINGTPMANAAKNLWLKIATPNDSSSESSFDVPRANPAKNEWRANPMSNTIDEK